MIRILYTIPNLKTAGSGRAMLNVIRHLDPARFEAAVCLRERGGPLEQEFLDAGVRVLEHETTVPLSPRLSLPGRIRAAAAPLKGEQFDLWHSFHYLDDYSEPLIARAAGARAWVYTKKNMSWNHRSWWLRTALARRVAVQNTDMMTRFFGNRLFQAKADFVPRGIPLDEWSLDPAAGVALREDLGIPADAQVVACVAQIIPRKGQRVLVQALAELPGVHVLLAGRENHPGYVAEIRADVIAAELDDRVHWLGQSGDVRQVLASADVFCLPTDEQAEGCPVALLEAMAAGMACVATDVPGSRDVLQSDRSGLVVPPNDPAGLAGALRRVLDDPALAAKLRTGARSRAEEEYSIELEAQRHEQLYLRALGRS